MRAHSGTKDRIEGSKDPGKKDLDLYIFQVDLDQNLDLPYQKGPGTYGTRSFLVAVAVAPAILNEADSSICCNNIRSIPF